MSVTSKFPNDSIVHVYDLNTRAIPKHQVFIFSEPKSRIRFVSIHHNHACHLRPPHALIHHQSLQSDSLKHFHIRTLIGWIGRQRVCAHLSDWQMTPLQEMIRSEEQTRCLVSVHNDFFKSCTRFCNITKIPDVFICPQVSGHSCNLNSMHRQILTHRVCLG